MRGSERQSKGNFALPAGSGTSTVVSKETAEELEVTQRVSLRDLFFSLRLDETIHSWVDAESYGWLFAGRCYLVVSRADFT